MYIEFVPDAGMSIAARDKRKTEALKFSKEVFNKDRFSAA
jgi:hypothetical protein